MFFIMFFTNISYSQIQKVFSNDPNSVIRFGTYNSIEGDFVFIESESNNHLEIPQKSIITLFKRKNKKWEIVYEYKYDSLEYGFSNYSEGKFAKELYVNAPSVLHWVDEFLEEENPTAHLPVMNGQLVFKNAVVRFSEVINEGLSANNLTSEQIDMLIPHQANLRISQFIQRKFKLPDNKVFNNIQKYGNTTAASIAIALKEAVEQKKIKEGDLVVLAAFGSGFTWGSVIMKW